MNNEQLLKVIDLKRHLDTFYESTDKYQLTDKYTKDKEPIEENLRQVRKAIESIRLDRSILITGNFYKAQVSSTLKTLTPKNVHTLKDKYFNDLKEKCETFLSSPPAIQVPAVPPAWDFSNVMKDHQPLLKALKENVDKLYDEKLQHEDCRTYIEAIKNVTESLKIERRDESFQSFLILCLENFDNLKDSKFNLFELVLTSLRDGYLNALRLFLTRVTQSDSEIKQEPQKSPAQEKIPLKKNSTAATLPPICIPQSNTWDFGNAATVDNHQTSLGKLKEAIDELYGNKVSYEDCKKHIATIKETTASLKIESQGKSFQEMLARCLDNLALKGNLDSFEPLLSALKESYLDSLRPLLAKGIQSNPQIAPQKENFSAQEKQFMPNDPAIVPPVKKLHIPFNTVWNFGNMIKIKNHQTLLAELKNAIDKLYEETTIIWGKEQNVNYKEVPNYIETIKKCTDALTIKYNSDDNGFQIFLISCKENPDHIQALKSVYLDSLKKLLDTMLLSNPKNDATLKQKIAVPDQLNIKQQNPTAINHQESTDISEQEPFNPDTYDPLVIQMPDPISEVAFFDVNKKDRVEALLLLLESVDKDITALSKMKPSITSSLLLTTVRTQLERIIKLKVESACLDERNLETIFQVITELSDFTSRKENGLTFEKIIENLKSLQENHLNTLQKECAKFLGKPLKHATTNNLNAAEKDPEITIQQNHPQISEIEIPFFDKDKIDCANQLRSMLGNLFRSMYLAGASQETGPTYFLLVDQQLRSLKEKLTHFCINKEIKTSYLNQIDEMLSLLSDFALDKKTFEDVYKHFSGWTRDHSGGLQKVIEDTQKTVNDFLSTLKNLSSKITKAIQTTDQLILRIELEFVKLFLLQLINEFPHSFKNEETQKEYLISVGTVNKYLPKFHEPCRKEALKEIISQLTQLKENYLSKLLGECIKLIENPSNSTVIADTPADRQAISLPSTSNNDRLFNLRTRGLNDLILLTQTFHDSFFAAEKTSKQIKIHLSLKEKLDHFWTTLRSIKLHVGGRFIKFFDENLTEPIKATMDKIHTISSIINQRMLQKEYFSEEARKSLEDKALSLKKNLYDTITFIEKKCHRLLANPDILKVNFDNQKRQTTLKLIDDSINQEINKENQKILAQVNNHLNMVELMNDSDDLNNIRIKEKETGNAMKERTDKIQENDLIALKMYLQVAFNFSFKTEDGQDESQKLISLTTQLTHLGTALNKIIFIAKEAIDITKIKKIKDQTQAIPLKIGNITSEGMKTETFALMEELKEEICNQHNALFSDDPIVYDNSQQQIINNVSVIGLSKLSPVTKISQDLQKNSTPPSNPGLWKRLVSRWKEVALVAGVSLVALWYFTNYYFAKNPA